MWNGQESAVNIYNIDGTYIESKSLPESPGVVLGVNTPDGYVFSTAQYHEEGKLDSLIYICDKSFKVKKKLISSEEKSVVGILPPKNFLQYAEGKVIYFDKFTNRLFLIDMEHEDYNVVPYTVEAPKLCKYEHYCDMSWRFEYYDKISSFAFNGHDMQGTMCVKGMNHNFKFDFGKNVFHVDKREPDFAPSCWLSYKNGVYYGMFSPEEFGSLPWGLVRDDSHAHENNTYNFIKKQMSKYPNQENLVIVKLKANPNFPERQL